MKQFLRFISAAALMALSMLSALAQSADTRWNGNEYTSVANGTTKIYLYNVGLGKFLINGGDWGTEGRLFYADFGKSLTLSPKSGSYYNLRSEIATGNAGFSINPAGQTNFQGFGSSDFSWITFVIFDGPDTGSRQGGSYTRNGWKFERVAGETGDVYTYYISQNITGSTTTDYHLGGAYGAHQTSHSELTQHGSNYDKCTYTTADIKNNETEVTVSGGTKVKINELYQWRIVTEEQLTAAVEAQNAGLYGGLNANISYLIVDQDFSSRNTGFYSSWNTVAGTNTPADADGNRYKFTWGYTAQGVQHHSATYNSNHEYTSANHTNNTTTENWYAPVKLKEDFISAEDAKYGYAVLEGIGSLYTSISVPAAGWYQVKCYGFHMTSDASHKAYAFASTSGTTENEGTYKKEELAQVTELASGNETYGTVTSATKKYGYSTNNVNGDGSAALEKNGTCAAGYVLTRNQAAPYEKTILIKVEDISTPLTFGVRKDDATKSEMDYSATETQDFYYIRATYNGNTYYLTSTDNETVSMTTNQEEAIKWNYGTTSVTYTRDGITYYLVHSGVSFSISDNPTNVTTYYNNYICYGTNNTNRYYLRIYDGEIEFTNYTTTTGRFSRSSQSGTVPTAPYYYHDADWVGVDNFQVTYMGDEPFVLDEMATDASYMTGKSLSNTTILLKRGFTQGEWNSLVLPVNMTTAQVKQTFGDETKLAVLKGLKDQGDVIEFEQVPLPSDGAAIEKNKLYIIKPVLGPSTASYTSPSTGEEMNNFYVLGRIDFDGTSLEIPTVPCYKNEGSTSSHASDGLEAKGTYIYLNNTNDNTKCCPAGSYVLRSGDMYHTQNNKAIKGFRGWIVDVNQSGTGSSKFNSFTVSEREKGDASGIRGLEIKHQLNGNVYNLNGQMVRQAATSLEGLPKGIYVVNRKKVVIK